MAKRFTNTGKWKDIWFSDLPSKYKLLWFYMLDDCDYAGVWTPNFKIAKAMVGEDFEPSEVKRYLKERIEFLSDEYWYIKKFITYQYKTDIQGLNPNNRVHYSIISRLNQFNFFKPLPSPSLGVKDKDKDKDKEKDKDRSVKKFQKPSITEIEKYCKSRNNEIDAEQFFNHYESNGWKVGRNSMKDWKASIVTWEKNKKGNGNQGNNKSRKNNGTARGSTY